jgi:Fe-S-cluster containining protein
MATPTLSRKEAIWLACKRKTCCHTAVVIPTGRDVWRIARTLDVPPWSFLVFFPSPTPRRDAFLLDRSGRQFRLAFGKRATRHTKTPPPCIFLLRTAQGHHRCGLGALRPLVCKTFPATLADDVLSVRDGAECTCRDWSLADVDSAEERALIAERQADAEEYCTFVARWNARVLSGPADVRIDFPTYCAHLLAAYDAIAASEEGAS